MRSRSSDFYQLRRGWIRDSFGGLGFLVGFVGVGPYGWPMMQAEVDAGRMTIGVFKFFGVLMAGGIGAGIAGLLVGIVVGLVWQTVHRMLRPVTADAVANAPSPETTLPRATEPESRKPQATKPEAAWAIRYDALPFEVDAFLTLAGRVWPREYDRARSVAALEQTTNVGAWHDGRLVGSVRVLDDGYFLATVAEVMVDPDYRGLGIGRELMRRALERAPRGKLFFGAQRDAVRFFERIGAQRGPTGFVMQREVS